MKSNVIEIIQDKQSVIIHLDGIAQLQKVFEQVTLNDIGFNPEGVTILLNLKC